MNEIVFLISLTVIWLIFASFHDLRKREVANWLNFSLIIFALGFRFFYSLFNNDFNLFYQGIFGLSIFFVLGNLLYYGRAFAGGDAKLMIALGTILPFSENFFINSKIFASFILFFLFVGGVYGLGWSFFLSLKDFGAYKHQFSKFFGKNKKIIYFSTILSLFILLLSFVDPIFFLFGILIFISPYLYLHAKSVDESSLVRRLNPSKLVEGDWLFRDVKLGNRIIKANWEGLSKKDINEIKKRNISVKVRYGIPFVPVFLISFLILIYYYFFNFNFIEKLFMGFF